MFAAAPSVWVMFPWETSDQETDHFLDTLLFEGKHPDETRTAMAISIAQRLKDSGAAQQLADVFKDAS